MHSSIFGKRFGCIFFIVLLTVVLGLPGCSAPRQGTDGKNAAEKQAGKALPDIQKINVLEHGWRDFGTARESGETWETISYQGHFCKAPDLIGIRDESRFTMAEGCAFRIMTFLEEQGGTYRYYPYLSRISLETMSEEMLPFSFSDLTMGTELEENEMGQALQELDERISKGYARWAGLDVAGDLLVIFVTEWNEEWTLEHYYRLELAGAMKNTSSENISSENRKPESLRDGLSLVSATDFIDVLYQNAQDRERPENVPKAYCMNLVTCFVYEMDGAESIMQVQADGTILSRMDLREIAPEIIRYCGKALNGTPVFWSWHDGNKVVFFTPEGILHDEQMGASAAFLDSIGNVLLWNSAQIVSYNVKDGTAQALCNTAGMESSECDYAWRNEEGDLFLLFDDRDESWIYQMSGTKKLNKVQVTLLQRFQNSYTTSCAEEYSRTHPSVEVNVSQMEDPRNETVLNRLAEEMKAGTGPDLLVISGEQLSTLQGAGVLASLEDLISADTRAKVFGGVLQAGRREGKLYGLACEASLKTLLVPKRKWDKDGWTLSELMEQYEKAKAEGAERFYDLPYGISDQQLLYDLMCQNIEDSPFVDSEAGTCRFDSKEFVELLKFCKENAERQGNGSGISFSESERIEQVLSGEAFGHLVEGSISNFSKARATLGDEYSCVSFPTQSGGGSVITCYDFVAVNARSEHLEEIRDLLEYFLSEDCQVKYNAYRWVQRDVILNHVREHVEQFDPNGNVYETPIFVIKGHSSYPLSGRKDGTSFAKEYVELMDGGRALSCEYELQNIVFEEAGAYFAGAKPLEEVAQVIQNRAQLYLNERGGL